MLRAYIFQPLRTDAPHIAIARIWESVNSWAEEHGEEVVLGIQGALVLILWATGFRSWLFSDLVRCQPPLGG